MPNKFYITTAIDYVNASPHIGHAYEKICADALARWHRFKREDVYFLTGTDENAQKNAQAAQEAGINVEEFVDKNAQIFKDLCRKLELSEDDFIRTTENRHIQVVQKIFAKLHKRGDIYKGNYEGLYCQGCEAFILEKDLKDGKCPEHNIEPEYIKEESYFFKLSKYQDKIADLLKKGLVEPQTRRNEILSRLKGGLNDLSVSRKGLNWGIPVPFDKEHSIYVWVDALINYISALEYPDGEKFKKYWPADIHIIGKGINWFHSCIWPAILLSAGIELPKKIFVHGYVNIKGKKISKSQGNIVDPFKLIQTYGTDALRYFLLRDIPFGEDGDFSHDSFIQRYNGDLANDLGNLLNRTLTMVEKYYNGKIPEASSLKKQDEQLKNQTQQLYSEIDKHMKDLKINKTFEIIWILIKKANKYIEESKPWQLHKRNDKHLNSVINVLIQIIANVAISIGCFMPKASEEMLNQLGIKKKLSDFDIDIAKKWMIVAPGTTINKAEPLFPRIKKKNV